MIYSIRGKLILSEQNMAVVECGGIGYKCTVSMSTSAALGNIGSDVMIYTYLYVREDALDLFGFINRTELDCFKLLISVSGVGPKAAIAILSELSPEKLALSIAASDVKSITKAQGVGPKLAQRVILELKDKVSSGDIAKGVAQTSSNINISSDAASEAISALVVLGYSQTDAVTAISKLDSEMSSQDMIKGALKILTKQR